VIFDPCYWWTTFRFFAQHFLQQVLQVSWKFCSSKTLIVVPVGFRRSFILNIPQELLGFVKFIVLVNKLEWTCPQ
jgi:hypothetical protein